MVQTCLSKGWNTSDKKNCPSPFIHITATTKNKSVNLKEKENYISILKTFPFFSSFFSVENILILSSGVISKVAPPRQQPKKNPNFDQKIWAAFPTN